MRTIRRIVVENFLVAGLAIAILFGSALYCLEAGEFQALRLAIYMAAFVAFAFPAITYLECRRVWLREDPAPEIDVTLPAVIVAALLFGCSYLA